MTIWDEIGQKVTGTTAKAVQKTKVLSDITRLNSMISDEESKLNQMYCQIGRLYVSMNEGKYEKEYEGTIHTIKTTEERIKKYKQEVMELKGIERCPNCGGEVLLGSAFCSSCGKPMPEAKNNNMQNFTRCDKCGELVEKGMRFCTSCGNMMQTPQMPQTEQKQSKICPKCGAEVMSEALFCKKCGNKF